MNELHNGRSQIRRGCTARTGTNHDGASDEEPGRKRGQPSPRGNGCLEMIPVKPRRTMPSAVALEYQDRLGADLEVSRVNVSATDRRRNFRGSMPPAKQKPGDKSKQGQTSRSNSVMNVSDVWRRVNERSEDRAMDVVAVKRTGWKTIRIFVSSTFTDFHHERDLLVKHVFPELRAWCEERRLHLVEVDLRWGVPEELSKDNEEFTLKTCLGEIDRCYDDNVMPYFLNMTSERIGYIPEEESMSSEFVDQYQIVVGLSVTEMEIVHAAYKNCNPNALFMLRDDSFVGEIDEFAYNAAKALIDDSDLAIEKLEILKRNIMERFEDDRVQTYKCKYQHDHNDPKRPSLKIDDKFSSTVLDFFKTRINHQYPPILCSQKFDECLRAREQHEAFMMSCSETVFGRKNIFEKIMKYVIQADERDVPCVLYGESGLGKSTVMAKSVKDTLEAISRQKINRSENHKFETDSFN